VTETLEDGRDPMAYATALLENRPPPERKPPCFFDPRHGPSTEEVEWAPPSGTPRAVPACAADALRIKEGLQPHGHRVMVDGRPMAGTTAATGETTAATCETTAATSPTATGWERAGQAGAPDPPSPCSSAPLIEASSALMR
jgi:hypothetical protein